MPSNPFSFIKHTMFSVSMSLRSHIDNEIENAHKALLTMHKTVDTPVNGEEGSGWPSGPPGC